MIFFYFFLNYKKDGQQQEKSVPGLHARLDFHIFVWAGHHSHKHFTSLGVILSFQILIHSVLNVRSQLRGLQPFKIMIVLIHKLSKFRDKRKH